MEQKTVQVFKKKTTEIDWDLYEQLVASWEDIKAGRVRRVR